MSCPLACRLACPLGAGPLHPCTMTAVMIASARRQRTLRLTGLTFIIGW